MIFCYILIFMIILVKVLAFIKQLSIQRKIHEMRVLEVCFRGVQNTRVFFLLCAVNICIIKNVGEM